MRYVVLIAARNEEQGVAATIRSAQQMVPRPSLVLVVVNNTTDSTAEEARSAGAQVVIMEENRDKKAGALNFGIELLEPSLRSQDALMIMDADTLVERRFATVALETLAAREEVGAVGTVFLGRPASTLLGRMQQMEFHRYRREIHQRDNNALVLSGTASMIRWQAIQEVRNERLDGALLPRGESYYDTASLTEDNELTLALKTLGWTCLAPGVTSTTDVMESIRDLYRQRHRWYLGALDNVRNYGLLMPWHMRWTYWRQQAGLLSSLLVLALVLIVNVAAISILGFNPQWTLFMQLIVLVLVIHIFERVATVWSMGWHYRVIASLYIPELAYSVLLVAVYSRALFDHIRRRRGEWYST
ncbi:glycosyltransferase family 2 protein [Nesterenkonia suensis]